MKLNSDSILLTRVFYFPAETQLQIPMQVI